MVSSRAQSKGGRAEKLNRQFFPDKLVQASMPIPHRFLMMSKLSYSADAQQFTGFASDLGWPPGYFPTSITIQSDKTGVMKTFLQLPAEDYDGEFVEYAGKDCQMSIRIYND